MKLFTLPSHINSLRFLTFTKRKALLGVILGAISFYILAFLSSCMREGISCAVAFSLLGCFRLDFHGIQQSAKSFRLISLFRLMCSLACVFTVCIFSLDFLEMTVSSSLSSRFLFLNFLCVFILYAFFTFITGDYAAGAILSVLAIMILSTANGLVYTFRGKELCAMDFFSIGTAASVAAQYSYSFPPHISVRWMWAILIIFAQFSLPVSPKKTSFKARLLWLGIAFTSVFTLIYSSMDINTISYISLGSQINGFYLNFCLGIRDSVNTAPDDYSYKTVDNISMQFEKSPDLSSDLPNIIVIMNESFSDFDVFETQLSSALSAAPYTSSLDKNTIKGHALVSVFAGNTANSEFEFLSSHSMSFFPNPTNVVPYQQYINKPIFCMPHLMDSLGYETFATHPYAADNWSRDDLYPRFGFQKSAFIDSYQNYSTLRGFVSDLGMYDYILEYITSRNSNKPLFLFGVTMQNHSPYEARDFTNTIEIDPSYGNFPLAETYLSLIHESDKAVEFLLNELENYPEDTLVLFFGDHMPMIEEQIFPLLNGGSLATLDEQMLKYTVPFFIWANYDIEEYTIEKTSLNYLAGHLLDAAGIELPPYYQFLRDTEKIIPAINAYGYFSKTQDRMIPLDEAEGEEAEALQRYEYVQYNNMFDAKNRNELFFGQYINVE